MKKIIILVLMACLPAFSQKVHVLDTKQSTIVWKGKMWLSNDSHEGTIHFTSGKLTTDKAGNVVGANFEADMNTIKSSDAKPGKDGLADHLKNEDFFEVNKFPKAFFVATKAEKTSVPDTYLINGLLTVKGVQKKIVFTAKVVQGKTATKATGEFILYRSWWGVNYKSPDVLSSMKNELIADEVPIKLNLVFGK